jgi:NitT/TauT family transport system ATP-binding protein
MAGNDSVAAEPVRAREAAGNRIALDKVCKYFVLDDRVGEALIDVDLEIVRGDFLTIVGPSGCGKSTLLNLISGLIAPTTGTISYFGQPVTGLNTRVGYMTQSDNLLPWKTVRKNIELPRVLARHRLPPAERERVASQYIAQVGLTGFENHYPSELSGGMRKRVALARTLIYEPETLLMDEPFAALDAQLRLEMQRDLLALWHSMQKTVVFITHDLMEALTLGSRIAVMSARPGRITLVRPITFARSRNIEELRFAPEFVALYKEFSELLRTGRA